MEDNLIIAFSLTILAGLSTGFGSLIAFVIKERSLKYLTYVMGLAAGVMIYLSFMEMLPHASDEMMEILQDHEAANWTVMIAFFVGMFIVFLIDRLLPEGTNLHEMDKNQSHDHKLYRIGLMTAVALAIHNFPEGIATFISSLEDPELGMTIAFAIAMHNIPEGIAVSMPIYYATGNRKKAFMYSFLSGIVEPLGAFLCYFFLSSYLSDYIMSILIAMVAGIMVFISFDQLLPAASKYGNSKHSTLGVITGMILMALSLALLLEHGHAH